METINTTRTISIDLQNAGYKVATNKRNTLGLPQFHAEGVGNSVPDIFFWNSAYERQIFDANYIPTEVNIVRAGFLELKPGDHTKDLTDGLFKNTSYYINFISNKSKISINSNMIHNCDVFLLATNWSREGMICKFDEELLPVPIPYISEKYNFICSPYTRMIHSLQREMQKIEKKRLRTYLQKVLIPKNKYHTQTGIMISKIPFDENEPISYEYYAWMGNKILPIHTDPKSLIDFVKTHGKIIGISDKAYLIETKYHRELWVPKNQTTIDDFVKDEWTEIKITRWFYKKNESFFGIA